MADDASPKLYERDFYLWTQAQAEALRTRRAGEIALDYDHLAEEVADLGVSERNKVRSLIRLILEHLYKLYATGRTEPISYWIGEIGNFRADAENSLTPTIQRLVQGELEHLHVKAAKLAIARFRIDEPHRSVDSSRRWSWAEIMGEENDPIDRDFPIGD